MNAWKAYAIKFPQVVRTHAGPFTVNAFTVLGDCPFTRARVNFEVQI